MSDRLLGSTTHPIPFRMVLASDHLTAATGLTPVVTLSKDGGAFGAAAGAVTERANGWYLLAGNATDRNTTGTLLLRAAVATADDAFVAVEVTAQDPFAVGVALSAAAVQSIWDALTSALTTASSIGKKFADWVLGTDSKAILSTDTHSSGVTVAAVTAKTGYALTSGEHTNVAADVQAGLTAQGYTTGRGPLLDHLDADLTTRATPAQVRTQVSGALTADTIAELAQGLPPVTPTVTQALALMYMAMRNGVTEDGSYKKVFNDAGVCIAKMQTTDSGTVFTVHKAVTGP